MQGSAGPAGLSLGWADATGKVLPGAYGQAIGDGSSPIYIDPSTGYQWRLNAVSAVLDAEVGSTFWDTADCTGTAYYQGLLQTGGGSMILPPRVVFSTSTGFRVLKDDVFTGAVIDFESYGAPGDCTNSPGDSGYAYTAAQTTAVTMPTLPTLTKPLHPVLVGGS